MVEFSNLPSVTKIGEEPVMFKFKAQAPGSYTEIDPSRIACKIFEGADEKFSGFFPSQTSVVVGAAAGLQFEVSSTVQENGKPNSLITIKYTTVTAWAQYNWIKMSVPKANDLYKSSTSNVPTSLIDNTNVKTAYIYVNGSKNLVSQSSRQAIGAVFAVDTVLFGLDQNISGAGSDKIIIEIEVTLQPVISTLLEGFTFAIVNSGGATITSVTDTNLKPVEEAAADPLDPLQLLPVKGGITTTTYPTKISGTVSFLANTDGVGTENAQYQFTFVPGLPIPIEGVMVITVPAGITYPNGLTFSCSAGCSGSVTPTTTPTTITINNAFNSYINGNTVTFVLTGFTNPADSNLRTFELMTQYDADGAGGAAAVDIEKITGFQIQAVEGTCSVQKVYVTDGDVRIYAQPESYTFELWCSHAVETNYGIKIKFPSSFILVNRAGCLVTGYASVYFCQIFASTREILIKDFTATRIDARKKIKFTINSIINPGSFSDTGTGEIYTTDAKGDNLDKGTWAMPQGYYKNGNITNFRIVPSSQGVGEYPVEYQFTVVPNGEVERYAYLLISLPSQLTIPVDVNSRVRAFEDRCGTSLRGFTNNIISCVVKNQGTQLQIKDGFFYQPTTNLTDADGLYFPPELSFVLNGFQNPREGGSFGPFNISIYSRSEKLLYAWQTTDSPHVRVSGIAQPSYIEPIFENKKNGELTWLEFLITTTGGVSEKDKIIVKLPFGWQFTPDTSVIGRSNNVANAMESTISVDQRQIEITVAVALALKRDLRADDNDNSISQADDFRGRELSGKIESGLSFQFRMTNIRNRVSTRPSDDSMQYFVYSSAGVLFEEKTSGMDMQNTDLGALAPTSNGLVPDDFRQDFETNYTATIKVENFEKNMKFTLKLPKEIDFGAEDPKCTGLTGTSGPLICEINRTAKTLTFPNVYTFFDANPGQIDIQIDPLRNPKENLVTQSFVIVTQTYDGYLMDRITNGISINFYCEYPCAECPQEQPSKCSSCYQTSVERFFYENKCLSQCPVKMVETEDLTCTDCIRPCITCEGSPNYCLTCMDGYYVIEGGKCREEVTWYFPFVGTAFIFFILITISEIVTKRASNFKESLIAFWSIPEVMSWACLIWFMWHRVSTESYATSLACIGAIFYVCLNSVHAVIHPRYMVPNTLYSYKQLLINYKCGTFVARAIAYLFSFKFSLVLVSYFFNSPRLKGDYSAMNWKQFNRFSLAFILLPYACMMAGCILFIMLDGFWSYPGFVAAEVILLSTFISILLAIDAVSAIKCKTVGKAKTNRAIRVATGADYESDEDELNIRRKVRQQQQTARVRHDKDDFGESYDEELDSVDDLKTPKPRALRMAESEASYNSRVSQQTAFMNEEARKQIAMLEELAHQMREEKRQLQLDKERIEKEKTELQEEKTKAAQNMESYMEDYNRQTTALSNQVRDMERQKLELVHHVESRLDDGNRANEMLRKQVKEAEAKKSLINSQHHPQHHTQHLNRKNFRDFEGEMEDYEPVEEENSEDAQSSIADVVDTAQLPVKPAFGQIDYYRHMEGEDQHWMQQITPRAGGDSMLGQHDMEDEPEIQMEKNATAHFEVASVPPSAYEKVIEPGICEAEFQEITSEQELAQSEEFQQFSDAEMENISEGDERKLEPERHFVPERAVYSQLGDEDERTTNAEFFENLQKRVYEKVEEPGTYNGVEEKHFLPIDAAKGEGDKEGELIGPEESYFAPEPPSYEQMLDGADNERTATAQHFFNPEKPMQGDVSDAARSGMATPVQFFEKTKHFFGDDLEEPGFKEDREERLFNNEAAVKDEVSNLGRSKAGSEIMFHERESAHKSHIGDGVSKTATEQNFMNREAAIFSRDLDPKSKNATANEFFKQEEAIRGDITSNDQSAAATQQNYFANVEHAELGRADSYTRLQSDVGQKFMNKSDLGGQSERKRAAGAATPVGDVQGSVDYLNQSEAAYGRQSTVQEGASNTKYFEQDDNPAFGPAENYKRDKEVEHEFKDRPEEDSSGSSESSEGGIANHQPFTSGLAPAPQQKRQKGADPEAAVIRSPQKGHHHQHSPNLSPHHSPHQSPHHEQRHGHPHQQQHMQQQQHQQQPPKRAPKTILYSDKSETSVEDLMDDTPSNYNIANGRFEGKSLGLKALLLHAKDYQGNPQTLDPTSKSSRPELMAGLAGLAEQQNRSPQHPRPGAGMLSPGFLGAQKGIIGSQNDERQFFNNLYQTGQSLGGQSNNNQWRAGGPMNGGRAQIVGDESSNNGDGPGNQLRNTRNNVRTNKQYVEDPRLGKPPPGGLSGARSPNVPQNPRGRGAKLKVTKNNYFGGST